MTSLAVKLLIGACCMVGVVLVVLLSLIGYYSHVTNSLTDNSLIDYRGTLVYGSGLNILTLAVN